MMDESGAQVKFFVQRQLSNALAAGRCGVVEAIQLSTMKAILQEQARLPTQEYQTYAT